MYAPAAEQSSAHQQQQHRQPPQRPASAQHSSSASQQDVSGSPSRPDSRRRGSSFGFGSGFFSTITSSLRASSSSSNLQLQQQQPTGRSRASSSSRLHMVSAASSSTPNVSNSNTSSNGNGNGSLRTAPMSIVRSATGGSYSSDNVNSDMYAATPTDENMLLDATRANSPSARTRQKPDTDGTYSIRLTPFIDHSATTPALYFAPMLRKTRPNSRLAIGRYTDKVRDTAHAPQGSDAGVVFKSKVVSRTHGEFHVDDLGNWYVKDLKSSSGTFLNHVRLSGPGIESDDTLLQNGDVLQLGMDFRGGIEDVFRCVKMRVETNKSWQKKANKFNKDAHAKLKSLAMIEDMELSECAICLLKVKPCQAVFISPCSHCWHYKCIRPIVVKSYPQFLCPNCRETCDLEEDFDEEDEEEDDQEEIDTQSNNEEEQQHIPEEEDCMEIDEQEDGIISEEGGIRERNQRLFQKPSSSGGESLMED